MHTIEFENKKFRIRYVDIETEGIRIIASTALNKRLLTEEGDYKSDEARYIDEQIYFFVDNAKLKLQDRSLSEYVNMFCV
jgi:tyrosine-protein phosphatase YwqE